MTLHAQRTYYINRIYLLLDCFIYFQHFYTGILLLLFITQVQRLTSIFVWTNRCIHSHRPMSQNAAVGPYKDKSLNKCDCTIIIHLLLYF